MSRADEIRAELALLDLEAEFAASEKTPERKAELRAARQEFRELRSGSATAKPDTVRSSARVNTTGA